MNLKTLKIFCVSWLPALTFTAAVAQTNLPATLNLPPIATGPFKPDWNSLTNYQTPEWFRDAKFGIWAHWGPQCEPEHGDWYVLSSINRIGYVKRMDALARYQRMCISLESLIAGHTENGFQIRNPVFN